MAVRIVPGLAEGDEARPRASAHPLFGVVAGLAVAPEVARRAGARVAERLAALPDVLERRVADIAARPRGGWQRRAPLDGAIGLDAERRAARAARAAVPAVFVAAQDALVRPEVADVVARPQAHAELVAARLDRCQERKELQQIVGLKQDLGLVGRAAHRHC